MSSSMADQLKRLRPVICPYCGEHAALVTGDVVYPHRPDLYLKKFWNCAPCGAYVGCHAPNSKLGFDGTQPLGRLANAELRKAKSAAHAVFDPLWQDKGYFKSRIKAYNWLADKLKIPVVECHIGEFDIATCDKVVQLCLDHPFYNQD